VKTSSKKNTEDFVLAGSYSGMCLQYFVDIYLDPHSPIRAALCIKGSGRYRDLAVSKTDWDGLSQNQQELIKAQVDAYVAGWEARDGIDDYV
jgi:hypothetical protein